MNNHLIFISDIGKAYKCNDQQTLLTGMSALRCKGIPIGCCGGGCGVCKVEMLSGEYVKRPMSRSHVSVVEEEAGIVLACRVYPRSNIILRVIGGIKKNINKATFEKQTITNI